MNSYSRRISMGLVLSLAGLLDGCAAPPLPAAQDGDDTPAADETGGNGTGTQPESGGVDPIGPLTLAQKFPPLESLDDAVLVVSVPFDVSSGFGSEEFDCPASSGHPQGACPDHTFFLTPEDGARFDACCQCDFVTDDNGVELGFLCCPMDEPYRFEEEPSCRAAPPGSTPVDDPSVEDPNNVDGSETDDFYTVTNVGSLALPSNGLNNTPTVVGFVAGDLAAQWTDGLLDLLPMGTRANAINNEGIIAGGGLVGFDANAVMWEEETRTVLPGLSAQDSEATDINDVGQIVGWSMVPLEGKHAVIWESGTVNKLAALPNGTTSSASALNNMGRVVGWTRLGGAGNVPVLWDDGIAIDIGTPDGLLGEANDINDSDRIVGNVMIDGAFSYGFSWQHGLMTNLGSLGAQSRALGINNDGQIVGDAGFAFGVIHAVLWEHGELIDLNDRIADSGWVLNTAWTINDAGQIAGSGRLNGLPPTVFLLTPNKQPGQKFRGETDPMNPGFLRTITGPVKACLDCNATRIQLCLNIKAYLRQFSKAFEIIDDIPNSVDPIGLRTRLVDLLRAGGDPKKNLIPVDRCRKAGEENVLGECLTVGLDENLRGIWPDERIGEFLINRSLPEVMGANGGQGANAGSVSVQLQFALMIKGLIYNSAARLALHDPPEPLPISCEEVDPDMPTADFDIPIGGIIAADGLELVELADLWLDFANRWEGELAEDIPDLIGGSPDSLCKVMEIYGLAPCP